MGITSVNYLMASSYGAYNQKLTKETKQKLDELGIVYNQNIYENEARKLINQVQNAQNANQQGHLGQNSSSKNGLLEKAKELAEKLGIQISENMTFEQLMSLIESVLNQRIAMNKNNIDKLKELKNIAQEFANLQAEGNGSSGYDNTNQALMTSLEILSEYNKNFLNKH